MKPQVRLSVLLLLLGLLGIGTACVFVYRVEQAEREQRVKEFWGETADEYRPQLVLEPLPPIIKPPFVAAEEAEHKIAPNELVLGIEINGAARAYPINMLTGPQREIFNDEVGGQAIAATW